MKIPRIGALAIALYFAGLHSAHAQYSSTYECAADLNGNGSIDQSNEVAQCWQSTSGTTTNYECPLQAQPCSKDATGAYACPLGSSYACLPNESGQVTCSPNACTDTTGSGTTSTPAANDPVPSSNAPTDPSTGACLANVRIFPGRDATCKGQGVQDAFQDCCASNSTTRDSWGGPPGYRNQRNALIYAMTGIPFIDPHCSEGDAQTGLQRASGYCHYVGDYCGLHWQFAGCVQKIHAYCCYNSMLSRIIQEAGHAQIPEMGGWGSPDNPNCRGFTPQEFQSIDFSKVDLSTYYGQAQYASQSQVQSELKTNAFSP